MALEPHEKNYIGWAIWVTLIGLGYVGAAFLTLYLWFPGAKKLIEEGTIFQACASAALNKTIMVTLSGLALMWVGLTFGLVVKGEWLHLEEEANRTRLICAILAILGAVFIFI